MPSQLTRRLFVKQTVAAMGAALTVLDTRLRSPVRAGDAKFRGRFSICNETFGDWSFDKAFALAAECG